MPVAVLEKHGFIAGLHAIVYMSFYAYTVISMGTALICPCMGISLQEGQNYFRVERLTKVPPPLDKSDQTWLDRFARWIPGVRGFCEKYFPDCRASTAVP